MDKPTKTAVRVHPISEAFDRVAPIIDSVTARNPINAWMHHSNMNLLRSTFSSGDFLIELGCGTGTDAIELAKHGCRIFGFDISEGMVARAQEKVRAMGLGERVIIVVGRSADLPQVMLRSPWASFDGGFANFSLTYEEDLARIAQALAAVLKPGAFFICTLQNRIVLSEVMIYGSQLRFSDFLWRLSTPLFKDVYGHEVEIHPRSPRQVREAFGQYFRLRSLIGLPTFLPPVYLHSQYARLGAAKRELEWLDSRLAARFPWNRLGEHTLFKFQRR